MTNEKVIKYIAENHQRQDDVRNFPFCIYIIKKGSFFCVKDAENRTCMYLRNFAVGRFLASREWISL